MNWPHGPAHWLFEPGIYIVTAGTFKKLNYLNTPQRLDLVLESLFSVTEEFGWKLHAWAILVNHYHFVACSPSDPKTLSRLLGKLHMTTAKQLNEWDRQPGRKIWHQFWDRRITFEKSYLARLNYVNNNPVKHGVVADPIQYHWCSTNWFITHASSAFVNTVKGFKIDKISEYDDF